MTILQTQYGKISNETIKVYLYVLKNIPDNIFQRGIENILKNYTFSTFPKIADIYKACGLDYKTKARIAIAKLREVACKKSSGDSITFGDPILHQVALRFDKWDNHPFWSKENRDCNMSKMMDLYISLSESGSQGVPYIQGHYEKDKQPYNTNKVVLSWSNFSEVEHKIKNKLNEV